MHLDCVFSILGNDICLMLKDMMGTASPTHRLVDEYVQDSVSNTWHLERERVEFSAYMRDNGFHIIEIEGPDQLVRTCHGAMRSGLLLLLLLGSGMLLGTPASKNKSWSRAMLILPASAADQGLTNACRRSCTHAMC